MTADRRRAGMSLIELMVVVAIAGVLVALATFSFQSWTNDNRARAAARDIGDLLIRARSEAIRTGQPHMVFIGLDDGLNPLFWAGQGQAAMLIADLDGDAQIDLPAEHRDNVPNDTTGALAWGRSQAGTTLAPGDPFSGTPLEGSVLEGNTPGNFRHPTNPALIQPWVLFMPDGTPRAVVNDGGGGSIVGTVGTGAGGIYVTNALDGSRDQAVVVQPLGGIQVLRWDRQTATWR